MIPTPTEIGAIDWNLLEYSPNAYILVGPSQALPILTCNAAYENVVGRERSAIIGMPLFEAFPADEASESYRLLRDSFDRVLATHETDHIAFIPYDTSTAGEPPAMRYWSATHVPVLAEDGSLRAILQHTADITGLLDGGSHLQNAAIVEAGILMRANKVQDESRRLRELFDQAPGFVGILRGRDHVFEIANMAYRRLVGGRELVGKPVRQALPEVVDQGFITLLDEVYTSGENFVGHGVQVMLQQSPDAAPAELFVDFVYQPLRDARGAVYGIFVQGNDVTEQKRAEERMATITRESAHRVKNTLAMAQAVVSATLRDVPGVAAARQSILARLGVLAVTQPALVDGRVAPSDVAQIVPAVMQLHVDVFGRISIEGPSVAIEANAAQGLALILHELATNAIKYGALSNDTGSIAIRWSVPEGTDRVELEWRESGGPEVCTPQAKGFGTKLIERALPRKADNKVTLDYAPDGLVCRCRVELD